MSRFFLPRHSLQGSFVVLTGENARHARVLRLKAGDEAVVCDGEGNDFHCVVSDVSPGQVSLVVRSSCPAAAEPKLQASVLMAFAKADKLEHVVQKATELGACEIVAFPSARCVSRPDAQGLKRKLERWQKIGPQPPQSKAAAAAFRMYGPRNPLGRPFNGPPKKSFPRCFMKMNKKPRFAPD